ncbi:MAG: PEP-CTERM sorting domain-containing protein [Aquabacterium sp.]|uniref:PEP-CTERM sorting domain-containing protein n=1 Tax=Aquabacterium sp. TaxID=1872578 RepID=UPI0025C1A602|nr:PEP-CTERM sorting domain-containing protein [Aquabacterium sp.]MBI5924792.1 PEP-CTERM sorting domain-containing protein [Aquabacterium sp.]
MIKLVRRTAVAAGIAALSLASSASWAASYTYDFKTFFDTSTTLDLLDTKTLSYSVATLNIADVTGGVQLTLSQLANAFPAKTGGTFVEALWLAGPNGTLKLTSANTSLAFGSGYNWLLPQIKDAGYTYPWNIDFASKTFAEGETTTLTITGSGVTAAAFAKAGTVPMLNLGNIGSPYTGLLGLNTEVHFIGKLQTAPVPEPATYALMGLGLVGIAAAARRRAA